MGARNRRRLVLALAALLVLATILLILSTRPTGPINPAAFARIEEGMTADEVTTAVGVPPGSYISAGPDWSWVLSNGMVPADQTVRLWCGDGGGIRIYFAKDGRVAAKQWVDGPSPTRAAVYRCLRWFGL